MSALTLACLAAASACFLSDRTLLGAACLAGGMLALVRDMIEGPPRRRPPRGVR